MVNFFLRLSDEACNPLSLPRKLANYLQVFSVDSLLLIETSWLILQLFHLKNWLAAMWRDAEVILNHLKET